MNSAPMAAKAGAITIDDIQKICADHYKVSFEGLREGQRTHNFTQARAMAMCVTEIVMGLSLDQIAEGFGRGIRAVTRRVEIASKDMTEAQFQKTRDALALRVKNSIAATDGVEPARKANPYTKEIATITLCIAKEYNVTFAGVRDNEPAFLDQPVSFKKARELSIYIAHLFQHDAAALSDYFKAPQTAIAQSIKRTAALNAVDAVFSKEVVGLMRDFRGRYGLHYVESDATAFTADQPVAG